jgi:hypothetical protein
MLVLNLGLYKGKKNVFQYLYLQHFDRNLGRIDCHLVFHLVFALFIRTRVLTRASAILPLVSANHLRITDHNLRPRVSTVMIFNTQIREYDEFVRQNRASRREKKKCDTYSRTLIVKAQFTREYASFSARHEREEQRGADDEVYILYIYNIYEYVCLTSVTTKCTTIAA